MNEKSFSRQILRYFIAEVVVFYMPTSDNKNYRYILLLRGEICLTVFYRKKKPEEKLIYC